MKIDFNNQWFRDTCKQNGFDADNELSKSAVALAYECARDMKKYIDAREHYTDEDLKYKLDKQINRLNDERIGYMLNALMYAEIAYELGSGFNQFLSKEIKRKEILRRQR